MHVVAHLGVRRNHGALQHCRGRCAHLGRCPDGGQCARPPTAQVHGDAFLARVFDNEDEFERLDLTLPEVSSSAPWVKVTQPALAYECRHTPWCMPALFPVWQCLAARRASALPGVLAPAWHGADSGMLSQASSSRSLPQEAARQNEEKRQGDSAQSVLARMQRQRGPPPAAAQATELSPAEAEKERGNAAFKRGDLREACPSSSCLPALQQAVAGVRHVGLLASSGGTCAVLCSGDDKQCGCSLDLSCD